MSTDLILSLCWTWHIGWNLPIFEWNLSVYDTEESDLRIAKPSAMLYADMN